MVQALCILLACQLAGELLVRLAQVPIPGPVVGMVLLLIGFIIRGTVPESLRTVSRNLLLNMSLLFIPAGTGIMVHLHRVGSEWPVLAATLFISTALSIVVTALVFRWVQRWIENPRTAGEE